MSRIQHCATSGREWWVYASSADSLDRLLTAMNLLMVDDLLLHIYIFFCSKHSSRLDPRSFSLKIIKQFPSFTFHKSSTPSKTKSCYWTAIGCHSKPRPLHHTATTSLLPKCLGCATSLVPHCTWSAPWQLPLQPKRVGCESHEDPGWSAQVEFVIPQRVGESM